MVPVKTEHVENEAEVAEFTPEEARAYFDAAAQDMLGMSGEDFLAAWDRGDFEHETDRVEVSTLAVLIPLAR